MMRAVEIAEPGGPDVLKIYTKRNQQNRDATVWII